ncbi:unnamed protein product [Clonostachys chloroleuca]|uniref:HTH APSES-type domain-containing protein n=1 Tax=Clonostachys chloroleuca TaxID=1926264 RepID=A0AA35VC38_9HYPO|nr:unnamed protein product [Clonostachys chloroleuca]
MNPGGPDMYYQPHMSAGQPQPPQTVTSSAMPHYQHPQPPLLQPGHQYSPAAPSYNPQYGYAGGLTSPPAAPVSGAIGNSQPNVLPLPGVNGQGAMSQHYTFDTTGQQPPPGMKPRVTATLWEDEGSLCFQVEARGICVARREDNHMINGTKLLNVAGMTRGRRDGILKSEKVRHVVKIGPMHLKGVWIPYERALDFANKEKITELLYPLFVHNIGSMLYHPTNQSRTSQVMAAAERRKAEQQGQQLRTPPAGLPSINSQQSHPMSLPGPQPSLPSNSIGRPPMDRAHTFPTPPTTASGVMGGIGGSESFNWQGQGINGTQGTNPMGMEPNARSMPNTPITTPPSHIQFGSNSSGYDNASRPMYNGPSSQHASYAPSNGATDRVYAPGPSYPKHEMAPPSNRPSGHGAPTESQDAKPPNGVLPSEHAAQPHGEDDDNHEHEQEYTHDSGAYEAHRSSYNYTAPGVGALTGDANVHPEMTGSPNHPTGSGRATPRTTGPTNTYYPHNNGYATPPPSRQPSSSLYSVITNDRSSSNGASGNGVYNPADDMNHSMPNGYSQPPVHNGMKRGRDDDGDHSRAGVPGDMGPLDLKRRKTLESSVPAPAYDAMNRPASAISGGPQQR